MNSPDVIAQRNALKKLAFLVGKYSGEASILRGPGQLVELQQTEEAQFKLNGLILMIEGVGRLKSDSTPILQALGLISFDDTLGKYQMRAFNDGRWLETEVKLLGEPNAISWGFALTEMRTESVLRVTDTGEWIEHADFIIGTRAPQTLLDLRVQRLA
jgi:hypothetical protein